MVHDWVLKLKMTEFSPEQVTVWILLIWNKYRTEEEEKQTMTSSSDL